MGAAAETIQFNTRIERSLKLAGDDDRPLPARANARIESPSQLEALRRGREEAARAFADMGFGSEMPSSVAFDPYDQLMEEFILERHGEEGVRP